MEQEKEFLQIRNNIYSFLYRMFLEEPPKQLAVDLVKGTFPVPTDMLHLNPYMDEGIDLLIGFMKKSKDVGEVDETLASLSDLADFRHRLTSQCTGIIKCMGHHFWN
jgi:hypothetical protein